ncbi:MAG: hypothetical protein AB8B85_02815 [Paracoccaceae bacterium]
MRAVDERLPVPGIGERALGFWTPRRLIFPILVILATFLIFTGRSPGLADPDYYWHLATGALIWRDQALPTGDPFSWTFEGQPWVLHEWAFQVLLHLWHDLTGPLGVVAGTAFLLALAAYIVFATADRMIRRPLISLGLLLLFGAGIVSSGAPRPHIFSLIFFAIYLAVFFEAKYGTRRWPLLAAPLIMIAWVNLHGGYAIGIVAMAAFAGLECLNLLLRFRDKAQVRLCLWLGAVAVATLAAALINPDGIKHLEYPPYVAKLDLVGAIVEWQSIMTSPWRGPWYAVGGVAFFVIALRRGWPVDATAILFPAALFIAGAVQARHAPFATLGMVVFAAPALWQRDAISPSVGSSFGKVVCWGIAVVALLVPLSLARSAYFKAIDAVMPSDVVTFMTKAELPAQMFNDYDIGGYLIAMMPEGYKVFIDPRADLYGDAFYRAYADTLHGQVPLSQHFDGWEIGHVVIQHRHALKQILLTRGDFKLVFEGRSHSVLVRR